MFAIHDVFEPTRPVPKINGPVRVIETVGREKVILIAIRKEADLMPFSVSYENWLEYLESSAIRQAPDPYLNVSSIPGKLPARAAARYKEVLDITAILMDFPSVWHSEKSLSKAIAEIALSKGKHKRTIQRWVVAWLQSGRNPSSAISIFQRRNVDQTAVPQSRGKKRGIPGRIPELTSKTPAYDVIDNIKTAWELYVVKQKKKWTDAYHDMLIEQYGLPAQAFSSEQTGYFLDPILIEKHRAPTWAQTRYRFRQLKKLDQNRDSELPQGHRGKAANDVFGPGFFEIDATYFQIQLVSRLTKNNLVGRPTVYLIVDIFSNAIVGYHLTLENPSWATAALALYNCFSDKEAGFKRLGLPYQSRDWPCHDLPTMLRADRAELISNMGQAFPSSGIRVETPPPMNPEAKGSVEGKHSEIKRDQNGRFNLPGRFEKIRKRRSPDGKKKAALDIFEFERILVEIIMDLNRCPVDPRRIPPDALSEGAKVASRIGFYEWSRIHRGGFTRQMGPNFVYEHLLTQTTGKLSHHGIHVRGEVFSSDRLLELGYLAAAIDEDIRLPVAYNPLLASEIFFHDQKHGTWEPAYNTDPEIYRLNASFAEAENFRGWQDALGRQASFNAHGSRRQPMKLVRQTIADANKKKKESQTKTSVSKANVREHRAREKAHERSPGLNGTLPARLASKAGSPTATEQGASNVARPSKLEELKNLWKEVDAIRKH